MTELSSMLFSRYSEETLGKLASQAIEKKDYATLKTIAESHKYNTFKGLRAGKDALDLEAVQIVLQHTKFIEDKESKEKETLAFQNIISDNSLSSMYYWQFPCDLSAEQKFRDILFYILETKISKQYQINYHDISALENIAIYHAYQFIKKHMNKNAEQHKYVHAFHERFDKKFKSVEFDERIKLMDNEVKNYSKFALPQEECLNNEFGPILSRTYSKIISANDAYNIYKDIASSGKTGKAIITQLNKNIINDDGIVIFFVNASNFGSHFESQRHYIEIELGNPYIMTEAIAAHEIAHYIIQKVFHYHGMPSNICERFNDPESKLQYIGDWKSFKSENNDIFRFKESKCFDPKIMQFEKAYGEATKDILFKVADILKISDQVLEYKEYVASDLQKYLVHSHPILTLLFLDPSRRMEGFFDFRIEETILHNTIESIMNYPEFKKELEYDIKVIMMLDELNKQVNTQKKILESSEIQEVLKNNVTLKEQIGSGIGTLQAIAIEKWFTADTFKHIQDLLLTRYLPKIVEKLNLTKEQVYFLARAADLINREYDGVEQEPVVRCVELETQSQFVNMPEDILNACNKMNQFWKDYIFPHMDID
jgi:hypothetical protein